ncbi:MAG TPA: cyclic nucleotide-binding domain-containing protein, partial [Candidatus Limnocylindrales bacterium]|nr:cyclic nucleotide-binding domain-containing protein [Candidatus Limnocylindrales bacterium]
TIDEVEMATGTDGKIELLRRVPLLAGLGKRELEEVGRLADEVDVAAGKALMHEGESGKEFFVIVDGSVRIDREGSRIRTLGPGDFFGEIALVDGGPRTATATTETASRLLVLAHREFHSLLDRHPSIQAAVLNALAQRVRNLDPENC